MGNACIVLTAGLLIMLRWALTILIFLDSLPGRKVWLLAGGRSCAAVDHAGETEKIKSREQTKTEMIGERLGLRIEAIYESNFVA